MLNNLLAKRPSGPFDTRSVGLSGLHRATYYVRPIRIEETSRFGLSSRGQPVGTSLPSVNVAPHRFVARRGMKCRGMGAEFVQATSRDRIEYSFRSPVHLLAAYQHGTRREGESYEEGLPRSTLRDVTKKLIFAPADHEYREWHDRRTLPGVTYFYFDPAELQADFEANDAEIAFAPRLFFGDATTWSTAAKLKQAIDGRDAEDRLYFEALGVVLAHEL